MALRSTDTKIRHRIKVHENKAKTKGLVAVGLGDALAQSRHKSSKEISALLKNYRAMLTHQRFIDIARALYDLGSVLIGSTAGYVALLDEAGLENEVLFLDPGKLSCTVDPNLPMPIRGLRGEAYRNASPVYHNNFAASPWSDLMPEGHVQLDNLLFAPLVLEERAVGVMGYANKPGGFLESDVRLASLLADLAAAVLNNSKAKERWQNKAAER